MLFGFTASPEEVTHGQAYSDTQKSIYVTPSVEYAAHPVYAPLVATGPNSGLGVEV